MQGADLPMQAGVGKHAEAGSQHQELGVQITGGEPQGSHRH